MCICLLTTDYCCIHPVQFYDAICLFHGSLFLANASLSLSYNKVLRKASHSTVRVLDEVYLLIIALNYQATILMDFGPENI